MTASVSLVRFRSANAAKSITAAAVLATLAGSAHAGVISWAAALDGDWTNAANWSPMSVPGPSDDVEVGLSGAYTVTLIGGQSVANLTLSNPDATIAIQNAHFVWANPPAAPTAAIVNDGTILVNSTSGLSTTGVYAGNATASGALLAGPNQSGEVVLNVSDANGDLGDAEANITNSGTHGPGHTIRGKGTVTGDFDNQGLIHADRAGQELRVTADITQSGAGELRASNGAVLGLAQGATVEGGLLAAEPSDSVSRIRVTNGTALLRGGATIEGDAGIDNATSLDIGAGGITNNGVISVNTFSGLSFTQMLVVEDATIAGSGSIDLNVGAVNGDVSDATLATELGVTGTIAGDQSVTGKGRVTGSWINDGLFRADRDAQELRIDATVAQSAGGMLSASNNGVLGLGGDAFITGGLLATDTGGRISATVRSPSIGGGTRNTGTLTVDNGRSLLIKAGGLVNDGAIIVNTQAGVSGTFLQFDDDTTISGTGTIDLNLSPVNNDLSDAQITTLEGVIGTIGAGQTITGEGQLAGDFNLLGTVNADRDGQDLRIQGTLDATGGGVVSASNNGAALFDQCTVLNATLESATGGRVEVRLSNTTFSGVTNNGDAGLRTGSTLVALTDLVNNGLFLINTEQGVNTTVLEFATGGAGLLGTGEARLNIGDINNDLRDAQITAADGITAVHGANHTITGKGRVSGAWVNSGAIVADRPGQELELVGAFDQSAGGEIRAENGGLAVLRSAEITGGTLASTAGGLVEFANNNNALDGVTSSATGGLRSGAEVILRAGGLTNNGLFTINSNAGVGTTTLAAQADATIDGAGELALGVFESNSDFTDATLIAEEGAVLTLGPGQTLTGKGRTRGHIVLEGTIAPGNNPGGNAIDLIRIRDNGTEGSLTLAPSSEFAVEASAEEVNDTLDTTVPIALQGGTLRFTPVEGFDPPRPTRYTIIEGAEITGTFGELIYEGTLPEGGVFRVVYEDTEVIAAVTCKADIAAPIGVLDLADISVFTQLFLTQSPLVDLAPPFGVLDLSDIGTFIQEFLAGCGG